MVNAGGIATLETGLIPLSIGAGVLMALIAFIAQKKWYDNDNESALVKALMKFEGLLRQAAAACK